MTERVLALAQSSRVPGTLEKRDKAVQLLAGFLQQLHGVDSVTLETCAPDHIALFAEHFSRTHGRSQEQMPDGPGLCSPGHLEGTLSALRQWFERQGRRGPWDPQQHSGNPCDAPLVADVRRGYRRQCHEAGYRESSAVPMTYAQQTMLMGHLDGVLAREARSMERLLLLRDATLFSYAWGSAMRGMDVGRLLVSCLEYPSGKPALLPFPHPVSEGFTVLVRPYKTKVCQDRTAEVITLVGLPEDEANMCPLRWLDQYARECLQAGQPLQGYIFRPLSPCDKSVFVEDRFSSASQLARLVTHLQAAGQYCYQTMHSYRRGVLQHDRANGARTKQLLQKGQMASAKTLARYLDLGRGEVRLAKRQRVEAAAGL